MEYNIIDKYIKFIKKEFNNFFKLVLNDDYSKKICNIFIDRYVDVRYYDETDYPKEKDFIYRINKEFISLYDALMGDDDNLLKNVIALFGYLICFDDTAVFERELDLINTLVEDENIKVIFDDESKKDLTNWYKEFKKKKDEFNASIVSKDFQLVEKRLCRNTFKLDLEHSVKVSNLYSEYAINKVYNSGTVYEERLFITYIMASFEALENARNANFAKHYVVDFPSSLFDKSKKIQRLMNILDNTLSKKMITVMINYEDYLNHTSLIDSFISEGYSIGVNIDSSYDDDYDSLIKFSYVFVNENSEFYDMIISEKDRIKTRVVVL